MRLEPVLLGGRLLALLQLLGGDIGRNFFWSSVTSQPEF